MRDKVIAFMNDMETNDAKKVAAWFTEESTLWVPPAAPIKGLSRIQALFRALFARYEHVHWNVIDIMPVSETRCLHISDSWGCMKGCPEYTNRVITDIEFDCNGKISSLSDYFKDTAVFVKK